MMWNLGVGGRQVILHLAAFALAVKKQFRKNQGVYSREP